MIAMIVLPTLVIYVAILGAGTLRLQAQAREKAKESMARLAQAQGDRFDGAFREAAAIALTTARHVEAALDSGATFAGDLGEERIFAVLTANVMQNPSVYGAAMAFVPGAARPADVLYCPYVYRKPLPDGTSVVERMNITRDVYDWYSDEQWQWWRVPADTGEPAWSDPYYDEGAGGVLMVTFSAPIFARGELLAVTTIDIMLPTLRERLGNGSLSELDFVITTRAGQIVFSPDAEQIMTKSLTDLAGENDAPELMTLNERAASGVPGVMTVNGWGAPEPMWVFYAPIRSTGWSFIARIPEREALAEARANVRSGIIALSATLLLIVGCIWVVSGRVTRPVGRLRSNVMQIAGGDLEARAEGDTRGDEIGDLAGAFNQMTARLKDHVHHLADERVARQKVERDLDLAREIQRGLLPRAAPGLPGFEIAGWNQPADKTGGDFYDWLTMPNGQTIVTLADVTGHGIGPALIVAVCRAYLRASVSAEAARLCDAVTRVNDLLNADIPDNRFVTAVVGSINPRDASMTLVSAGHAPLLFYRAATGVVDVWEADAPPLGVLAPLVGLEAREFTFEPGDALVLVTDGFFEWRNASNQQYGTERLVAFVKQNHALDPARFIRTLYEDVLAFSGGTEQADDLTALVIRRSV